MCFLKIESDELVGRVHMHGVLRGGCASVVCGQAVLQQCRHHTAIMIRYNGTILILSRRREHRECREQENVVTKGLIHVAVINNEYDHAYIIYCFLLLVC